MKRIKQLLLILVLGLLINPIFSLVKADNQINISFFYSETCLNCHDMHDYLAELELEYSNINIISYGVIDDDNMDLLKEVADIFNQNPEVPTVVIGGLSFVGYNTQIELDLENTIIKYSDNDFVDVMAKILNDEEILITDIDSLERSVLRLPIIGEVEIGDLSLFLGAVVLGLVDGFNPCAMWVLIFLISMLINMKDRKRMWIIGITFLFTSALVYFLIMVSWLQLAVSLVAVTWIRYLIGLIALVFGGYNIYKFVKTRNVDVGCEVTNDKQRKKIIEKIKGIVKKRSLIIALLGVMLLALTVNLIELACSAGLPLLYTQILAYNDLSTGMYFFYIGIYILLFLIDDLIIFTIAMITMKVTGISNKYSRYSTVIGGVIMLIIAVLLIFFPNIIMFNI
ncbi:hypothetical protein RJI07_00165 [Mycoplasmatota bacterium WC30]